MLLRVVRGRVARGRETDFIAVCRRQVSDGARSPGLMAFFAGYRRVDGTDEFVIASTWETEEDAARTAGEDGSPRAADALAGIAKIDSVDRYQLLEPTFRGIVDAPGGVIRLSRAVLRPERRQAFLAWLTARDPDLRRQRLLVGWALGEQVDGDATQVIAVTAWPSPLVIESLAEPGRDGTSLFAATDQFVTDTTVEQYTAIGLELPDELADISSRRVIAARFASRDAADAAAADLEKEVPSARETPIAVAALGAPGTAADVSSYLVVARVTGADYPVAERLIADHVGEVILTACEPLAEPAGWSEAVAPA